MERRRTMQVVFALIAFLLGLIFLGRSGDLRGRMRVVEASKGDVVGITGPAVYPPSRMSTGADEVEKYKRGLRNRIRLAVIFAVLSFGAAAVLGVLAIIY